MFFSRLLYIYCTDQLADQNNKFFIAHLIITPSNTGFSNVRFKEKNPKFEGAFDIEKEQNNYQLLNWFVENLEIYVI